MTDKKPAPSPATSAGYAGDLDSRAAWKVLEGSPKALLVDVRSAAEWAFVGVPDLSAIDREVLLIEWQSFPGMAPNARFVERLVSELSARGVTQDTPVLFLCRSGARSRAAAIAMTRAGHSACFNVSDGFEGDLDPDRHRGSLRGWKAAGLPWAQT